MPELTASSEFIEFALPCETCHAQVTIRSQNPKAYIVDWLDGVHTVRCSMHRAR